MINPAEHVYSDDPRHGHPDVRTRLAGVNYFFLANGLVQAAVQCAPRGEGTPLGLLIMNPERLRAKRDALTLDAEDGLTATTVRVAHAGGEDVPRAGDVQVRWSIRGGVPAAEATWRWRGGRVCEVFFCPDRRTARLVREVTVFGGVHASGPIHLRTGVRDHVAEAVLPPGGRAGMTASFVYTLDGARDRVDLEVVPFVEVSNDASRPWAEQADLRLGHERLDRFWRVSRYQLSAAPSAAGRMDGSIWQYNREWVRDQALVALGFLHAGDRHHAALILRRLLCDFITADGAAIDSSEVRSLDEVELDQNGVLLYAVQQYVRWTGDLAFARDLWPRLVAVADYPLRPEFVDPRCGLLHNSREFWERHYIHGITPGFELVYQVFVAIGLDAAASLARRLGHEAESARWHAAAARLRHATLDHPVCALAHDGVLVKRKTRDGRVHNQIAPLPDAGLPASAPLAGPGAHWLNPDTCVTLPIVFGFVPPDSPLARRTLDSVEPLWNEAWQDGGYGRYACSSEPDSPGGWPVASLFVARAAVETGVPERAWRVLDWLDTAPGAAAGSWFEFHGDRASPPFPQVGILPWTWAEMITLMARHVVGVRPEETHVRVAPRLLPGLEHVTGRFPIGAGSLHLDITRDPRRREPVARVTLDGGTMYETAAREATVPYEANDARVELVLPGE
jgi:hypothetical protein